jgi:predicted Zn-dependent peptidase
MPVFERQKLDNGLRVLTAPMPHAQSVACFIMLAAGSRYEEQSNRGIAHFAEHMFFKGTKRRPSSRHLTTLVDGIGGEFNAFTSKEYTGYYVRCSGADRDTALDVLIDMIRNSKFDPEEIEREKGVILEEMNMYFDTPRDYIGSVFEGIMFGDNPLGWETLGTKDTIRNATRDTFLDYVNEWYTPDRMVIGVSGMVGKNLVPTLERMLGKFPANGRKKLDSPAQQNGKTGPFVRLHRKDSDQAQICIGVPSLPLEHPDRYALQLLATVLGTGMSSRLFLEVRERRGLAYYVYGSNHSYTDAGSLYAQAGVDLTRIDDAISVIVEQFQRMADEKVPAKELEKARSLAKGRFVLHTESPQSLLMFGLRREVLEGKAVEPRRILAELDKVTAKDIQRVAQDLIDRKALHLAVIGPFDDEDRFRDLLAGKRRRPAAAKPKTAARTKPAAKRRTAAKPRAAATKRS